MNSNAWITKYLAKKGKDMFTLKKALLRMTKDEITRKAEEVGFDDIFGYKKAEMVRILIDRLNKTPAKAEVESTEYDDPFFKSAAAKAIFYLIYGSGTARTDALKITEELYTDAAKAREWRNNLMKLVHPDSCQHPQAGEAAKEITRIYKRMIAR